MLPCIEIDWLCCLPIESPSFAHTCFSFLSLSFTLAKCLIRLKNITREFWKFNYSEIYFVLTKKSMLSVIQGGMKTKNLVGCVKMKLETPSPALEMSLAIN